MVKRVSFKCSNMFRRMEYFLCVSILISLTMTETEAGKETKQIHVKEKTKSLIQNAKMELSKLKVRNRIPRGRLPPMSKLRTGNLTKLHSIIEAKFELLESSVHLMEGNLSQISKEISRISDSCDSMSVSLVLQMEQLQNFLVSLSLRNEDRSKGSSSGKRYEFCPSRKLASSQEVTEVMNLLQTLLENTRKIEKVLKDFSKSGREGKKS